MFLDYIISTNIQKVLKFFCLNPGKLFYEREVAKGAQISYGSANSVLRKLHKAGVLQRDMRGRMCYYRIDVSGPYIKEFKTLVNILMLEPVIGKLKKHSRKVVLYGSWAEGTDADESDIDLFVVSSEEENVRKIIDKYSVTEKIANKKMQCVIYDPADLINIREREKVFLGQVDKGKVLWERGVNEDNI